MAISVINFTGAPVTATRNGDTLTVDIPAATQSDMNTGSDTSKVATASTIQKKDDDAVALTDAATIDITGPKHTLTTASSRTFTNSFVGDGGTIEITLNATSATQTFPAAWKCISEGVSSGNNSLSLSGTSGDVYSCMWWKVGSNYRIAAKNLNR